MRNQQLCPVSTWTPRATVDDEGWCQEHGWECDDFQAHLEDQTDSH